MENTEIGLRPEQEAVLLTERIKDNGRTAVNAVCNIGKDLRRMKNGGLYVHLGYETFEDYAEKEFDLKRRQAYLYISVYEKLGEDFVQSNAQLGITKLAMLTTVNAEERAEIIENNDVKAMSTKEFDELLAKYKEQGEQLSMLEEENEVLKKQKDELKTELDTFPELEIMRQQNVDAEKRIHELEEMAGDFKSNADELFAKTKKQESKINSQQEEIEQLRKKNQELEVQSAEPVIKEVKVPDKEAIEAKDKEIEKLKKNIEKLGSELKDNAASAEAKQAELEDRIAEMQKNVEKPADNADKHSFKALFTAAYKEITGLIEFIKEAEDTDKPLFANKTIQFLEASEQALKEAEDNE